MIASGLEIEYLELYVEDHKASVDYFVDGLGFSSAGVCDGPDFSSTLLRQGETQMIVTSGPATHDYVGAHGDGFAVIAIGCDDPARICESAAEAGARTDVDDSGYSLWVPGLENVRHVFLRRPGTRTRQVPDGRDWTPAESVRESSHSVAIRTIDHLAVCLEAGTLHTIADFYMNVLDFERYSGEYVDVGGNAMDSIVVRSDSGRVTLTLIEPDLVKGAGQLDDFLAKNNGPGIQHVAFLLDDIFTGVAERRATGIEFLTTPDAYYDMLPEREPGLADEVPRLREARVLADQDEWGRILQVFTKSPYPRRTLFYELIERRGARGFGSANIRALYEAVERERSGGR
jgi:4-hydroxymandelate synthase